MDFPLTSSSGSPIVPALARKLKAKKRASLVNPADPQELSASMGDLDVLEYPSSPTAQTPHLPSSSVTTALDSTSPQTSPEARMLPLDRGKDDKSPKFPRLAQLREETSASFALNTTPGRDGGVRGILRPAGTPGSGNGVRFFPKNKFRVITPNAPALPPPTPIAAPSFFSQLLAVLPSSPRPQADDSWEQPGQEGEVSLVASSTASFFEDEGDDAEAEEPQEPWTGVPEIISSPLGLPEEPSRDVSQEMDLNVSARSAASGGPDVSGDWRARLPEMSNLDSVRLSSPFGESFTIGDEMPLPRTTRDANADHSTQSARTARTERDDRAEQDSRDTSRDISHSTILRSPPAIIASPNTASSADVASPALPPRAFTSIFADLSVDQAEMSWPLAAVPSPSKTPRNVGDTTEFYDCLSMSMSPGTPMPVAASDGLGPSSTLQISPSAPLASSTLALRTPVTGLIAPTKALFAAHDAQMAALAHELDLHRTLVTRLQAEVAERDAVLVDLNLRAVEAEMRAVARSPVHSPPTGIRTPPREHAGDRTTMVQAEVRDLQIRLAKAVAEADEAWANVRRAKAAAEDERTATARLRDELARAEERERDAAVVAEMRAAARRQDEGARAELDESRAQAKRAHEQAENALGALDDVRAELSAERDRADGLEEKLEEAARAVGGKEGETVSALEEDVRRLEVDLALSDARGNDAERRAAEAEARADELEIRLEEGERRAEESKRVEKESEERDNEWRRHVEELEAAREAERTRRKDAERRAAHDVEMRERLEAEVQELRAALAARPAAPPPSPTAERELRELRAELARLRAESSSKNFELAALQRRKAELKNDRELLNVALDSKQQEVELIKRKYGVRGVAGSTPLAESGRANAQEYATPAPRLRSSTAKALAASTVRRPVAATPGAHAGALAKPSAGADTGLGLGLVTPAPARWAHGVALSQDTLPRAPRVKESAERVGRIEEHEHEHEPRYERRSLRRAMPA
ncbi:hypothetical protein Q5752_003242 [Cryptotrichosporon argae]